MDILEILKSHHEKVKSLWNEAQAEEVEQKVLHLYQRIQNELLTLAYLEESLVYPAFRNYPEFEELLKVSYADHAKVREDLRDIDTLARSSGNYGKIDRAFDNLMDHVEKHVAREEGEFFSKVRNVMKAPERDRLGRHFETAREERKSA